MLKAGARPFVPRLAVTPRPRVSLRGDALDPFGAPPPRAPSPWQEEQNLRARDAGWWKLDPSEQDEVLAASSDSMFGGGHVEVLKSDLFNMDEDAASRLPRELQEKRSLRLSMVAYKRFPELATEDSELGRAMRATLAPRTPEPARASSGGFRFGSCSQEDPLSMGGWVPDAVERAACYGVHTVAIVGGVLLVLFALKVAGEAAD